VALKSARKSSCALRYFTLFWRCNFVWSYSVRCGNSSYWKLKFLVCGAAATPPASSTTTCTPTWTTHENRNSINGMMQTGVTTVEACRAACLADERCVGLDWNPSGPNHCWLHRDQLNGPYTTIGVTQHRLTRCEPTSGMTSSALRDDANISCCLQFVVQPINTVLSSEYL